MEPKKIRNAEKESEKKKMYRLVTVRDYVKRYRKVYPDCRVELHLCCGSIIDGIGYVDFLRTKVDNVLFLNNTLVLYAAE